MAGYLDLITNEFYWGEIPRESMLNLLKIGEEQNTAKALDVLKTENPRVHEFITRANRGDWLLLMDLPEYYTAVDLGSGWGSITEILAKSAGSVISVEATEERVLWQTMRNREMSLDHVHLVRGNALDVELATESVDLILANGLVEWIGLMNEGPVETLLENFLAKNFKSLKYGGYFYCGIENRYMAHSFFGELDHSGYRFTNLMPRWLADLYCKLRGPAIFFTKQRDRGYRTYTYSYRAWRRMLESAGFSDVRIYGQLPTYNNIELQCDLENGSAYRFMVDNFVGVGTVKRRLLASIAQRGSRIGLQKIFHPYFGIIARKQADPRSRKSGNGLKKGRFNDPDLVRTRQRSGNIIGFDFQGGAAIPIRVFKTVRHPDQSFLVTREVEALRKINRLVRNAIEPSCPSITATFQRYGRICLEQPFLPGLPLGKYLYRMAPSIDELPELPPIQQAFKTLERLAELGYEDPKIAEQRAWEYLEALPEHSVECKKLKEFRVILEETIATTNWATFRVAPCHGDFALSNLMVEGDALCAVLDWEHFDETGLPLLDSLFFSLAINAFVVDWRKPKIRTTADLAKRYEHAFDTCFLRNNRMRIALARHIHTVLETSGMRPEAFKVLFPLFLAGLCTRGIRAGSQIDLDPIWAPLIDMYVPSRDTIETIHKE